MEVYFWCATVDNYDYTTHAATPSASGLVTACNSLYGFKEAEKAARESLANNAAFTIIQFNKVS